MYHRLYCFASDDNVGPIEDSMTNSVPRQLTSLSVIIPGLNEADNLLVLYQELIRTLGSSSWELEILFVDDGSTDQTLSICRELHSRDPRFQYASLSRNFGHQHALTAGLDLARGQAVVIIDADLQDPPAVILEMIKLWEQGVEVVYGQRRSREGETVFKLATAKLFYWILRHIATTQIPEDTGDFRLMDRKVVDQLKKMREKGRFMRGLVSWVGFSQQAVLYERQARNQGRTKYPFLRMLRFAWDGVTSFSVTPLRLATLAGVAFSFLAFAMVGYYIFRKIYFDDLIKGWASVMIAIFGVGGVQLLFIGVIGEYLAKAFEEVRERPLYILKESSVPSDLASPEATSRTPAS